MSVHCFVYFLALCVNCCRMKAAIVLIVLSYCLSLSISCLISSQHFCSFAHPGRFSPHWLVLQQVTPNPFRKQFSAFFRAMEKIRKAICTFAENLATHIASRSMWTIHANGLKANHRHWNIYQANWLEKNTWPYEKHRRKASIIIKDVTCSGISFEVFVCGAWFMDHGCLPFTHSISSLLVYSSRSIYKCRKKMAQNNAILGGDFRNVFL